MKSHKKHAIIQNSNLLIVNIYYKPTILSYPFTSFNKTIMSIDSTAALSIARTGFHGALKICCYSFLLFSVWFTLRSVICSFLEEQVIFMVDEDNGEAVAVPSIQCSDRLYQMITQVSMIVPLKELSEFATVFITITCVYWVGFWVMESYNLELLNTAIKKEKAMLFFRALASSSGDQVSEFVNYWAAVLVSATIFAVVFSPLRLDASFRNGYGRAPAEDMKSVFLLAMVVGVTWRLFMIHLISSSVIAYSIYVIGPLLGWYPAERGPIWFVGLSVMLSSGIHIWEILFEITFFG